MNETTLLANFRTRLDAEVAGGLLTEADIPFVIQSAEGIGVGPMPAGASILVRPEQRGRAWRVLREAGVVPNDRL